MTGLGLSISGITSYAPRSSWKEQILAEETCLICLSFHAIIGINFTITSIVFHFWTAARCMLPQLALQINRQLFYGAHST
jgi:hypothetical protein